MRIILYICGLFLVAGCETKKIGRFEEKVPAVSQLELTQDQSIFIATKYLEQLIWKDLEKGET